MCGQTSSKPENLHAFESFTEEPTRLGAIVRASSTNEWVDNEHVQNWVRVWSEDDDLDRWLGLKSVDFVSWRSLVDPILVSEGVEPVVPEPTGYGAVVIADHVHRIGFGTVRQRFVRLEDSIGKANWRSDTGHWRRWDALSEVEVLFEGVK